MFSSLQDGFSLLHQKTKGPCTHHAVAWRRQVAGCNSLKYSDVVKLIKIVTKDRLWRSRYQATANGCKRRIRCGRAILGEEGGSKLQALDYSNPELRHHMIEPIEKRGEEIQERKAKRVKNV